MEKIRCAYCTYRCCNPEDCHAEEDDLVDAFEIKYAQQVEFNRTELRQWEQPYPYNYDS